MDVGALTRPCPTTRCTHKDGVCFEGDRIRAEAGHGCGLVLQGKMDAPDFVVAVCTCGGYRSAPGSERMVRRSHAHHADAKIPKHPS